MVDANGDGTDELVFSAIDRLSDPANAQLRIVTYTVNTTTGLAAITSTGSGTTPAGAFLFGDGVVDHAISDSDINGDGTEELAIALESTGTGNELVFLNPLTGVQVPGTSFPVTILTGGVTLDGI